MKFLLILLCVMTVTTGCQWLTSDTNTETNESAQESAERAPDSAGEITEPTTEYYQPYSEAALVESLENQEQAIIFFKASWCPTCREAEEDILTNSALLPEDVIIFHADYDTESELKERYGVVTQHTFVLVNQQQRAADSWIGGGVDEILEYVETPVEPDLVDDQMI